jgi:hypothetical protein
MVDNKGTANKPAFVALPIATVSQKYAFFFNGAVLGVFRFFVWHVRFWKSKSTI